jgi:hypothetical protein
MGEEGREGKEGREGREGRDSAKRSLGKGESNE